MAKKKRKMFYEEEELTGVLLAEAQTLVETLTKRRELAWVNPKVDNIDYAHHEPGMTACRIVVTADDPVLKSHDLTVEGLGSAKRCFREDRKDSAGAGRGWSAQRAVETAYRRWMMISLRLLQEDQERRKAEVDTAIEDAKEVPLGAV